MRILVLGSDGQIGSPLVKYLSNDHEVIEFDNYSIASNDLRTPKILDDILPNIDFVFFLAFDVGGSVYLKAYQDTYKFISNNVKIMNNTFASLNKSGTPFIFTSSQMGGMTYSSYGSLKRIGEYYTSSLNGKTVRLWNVYGQEHRRYHVITDFIMMAQSIKRINMRTTGEEKRQFLYVSDCCKCFDMIMKNFNTIENKSIDISSFEWVTIKDIAEIISSNFNNCKVFSGYETDDLQRDGLKEPSTDILKYWQPETSIETGIKKIINADSR